MNSSDASAGSFFGSTVIFPKLKFSARKKSNRRAVPLMLDLPAALATPSPIRDPQEPNDDISLVADGGEFTVGTPALVDARIHRTRVQAELDPREDPADVYRVFVPWGHEVVARVTTGKGVRLGLWGPKTASIAERKPAATRDLSGAGAVVRTRNVSSRKGAYYYLAATLAPGSAATSYLVSVELRGGR